MGFPVGPSPGDEYTAPSGAVYVYEAYGAWRVAEGQTDFDALSPDDITDLTDALDTDAAGILAKLLTVDTDDSGLNADTLDSQEGAWYTDIAARLGYTPFNAAHLPTGTKTLFFQAAAPTGWTKDTTHNDKAIRLVTGGSGGSAAGTTAFSSVLAARTIARANLPNVTLATDSQGAHAHDVKFSTASDVDTTGGGARVTNITSGGASTGTNAAPSAGAHAHTTDSINGGVTQTAMDFAIQYVDAIICTKD